MVRCCNNAPGPHECEKMNPYTGKPCNTIFSRSSDLTRHEDTIHNNRKQKVRCHLCTEEKTFSRNDALTRNMRVVHPDVDFPGSGINKRKGRPHSYGTALLLWKQSWNGCDVELKSHSLLLLGNYIVNNIQTPKAG